MKVLERLVLLFLLAQAALSQAPDSKTTVTFNRDIAPIIFSYCSACHRPGESGPFSLLNYSDVKRHGEQIAQVTKTGFMPPWLPAPGDYKFADERRLSQREIATIAKWVQQGEIEGDAKDLPPTPQFAAGWQLGKPDLVLKALKPVPAGGEWRRPVLEFRTARAGGENALGESSGDSSSGQAPGASRQPAGGFHGVSAADGDGKRHGLRRYGDQSRVQGLRSG